MSDGLIEDAFRNRPDNDDLAFLHFEKLYREPRDVAIAELASRESNEYWDSYHHFMRTYINSVLATVEALDLNILDRWTKHPDQASESSNFKQVQYDIDRTITLIKVRYSQTERKSSVRLDKNTKEKIRDYVTKIKSTIESISLADARKESLLNKLNAFSAEVDKDRTRFEVFGALVIDTATLAGKAEVKLRPIRKWLDSIAGVMRAAADLEKTQVYLPPVPKRITGPSEQTKDASETLWASEPNKLSEVDDDIPF